MGISSCQVKFLNNLKKARVPMISQCIAAVMHIFWSYLLVSKNKFNLGIVGTGISMVISNSTVLAINLLYTSWLPDIQEAVFWPDSRSY